LFCLDNYWDFKYFLKLKQKIIVKKLKIEKKT
jgi:hypothetical protein